mmetsp:Transcript_26653/g.29043  ORF Transcript_26653/g.29043 Transcript_26653/m.29043 type:complete len:220 (+) Transcript_26653:161-820(+)
MKMKTVLVQIGSIATMEVPVGTLAVEVDRMIRKEFPLIDGGGLDYMDDLRPIPMFDEESLQQGDQVMFRRYQIRNHQRKNASYLDDHPKALIGGVLLFIEGIDTLSVPIGTSIKVILEAIRRDYPQLIGGILLDEDGVALTEEMSVKEHHELYFSSFTVKWMVKDPVSNPPSSKLQPLNCKYLKGINRGLAMIRFIRNRLGLFPSHFSSNSSTFLILAW